VLLATGLLLVGVGAASLLVILRYTRDLASTRNQLQRLNANLESQRENLTRLASDLGRTRGDACEPLLADPREGTEPMELLDVHGRSISACLGGPGTVARMRATDAPLPLYGEDLERGDLRD